MTLEGYGIKRKGPFFILKGFTLPRRYFQKTCMFPVTQNKDAVFCTLQFFALKFN